MSTQDDLDIFLAAPPGLEDELLAEARELGFADPRPERGGVAVRGGWPEIWRANLQLRGAQRVMLRAGAFMAFHLAQLDKRARRFPWGDFLRPDVPVRVEASCARSKIYHAGAAAERVARAIAETLGAPVRDDAPVRVLLRIEKDRAQLSIDCSGAPLHKRGHKLAVAKAPLRETMAALMLRRCGYAPGAPLADPMCGSGTFVIEAAEMSARLAPGRGRDFAFALLPSFDAGRWEAMRAEAAAMARTPEPAFFGADRDQGAVRAAAANAERAGVAAFARFACQPVGAFAPPDGPPGLVMVNPPYGGRIGQRRPLFALYATLGRVLRERFQGWRVGLVTSDPGLARATELPLAQLGAPIGHGGMTVRLFAAGPL
ncbi:THUMP domain-containing class I SAM-dependent RNA methyltransferase [Oceanicella actignis]|uniref:Putative N6-adenine-specific DNA methylase n=1 Tax=Oceanicella actignis TaxID=1189325 RepID=A0A1M7TFW1_9RHOB|nr:RNA methyltransferase [Oceanicella actignis]SET60695.1 putative N6-adenine-specific DNA methylase [Oceanicella actignis]SHN69616.1 putative N6-adenine-specific DNA methylase [Oceanicella actignis]